MSSVGLEATPSPPFDFVDVGSSNGGSVDYYAIDRLGGTNGLGVERDADNVTKRQIDGYACVEGDRRGTAEVGLAIEFPDIS